jgi:hypothetical protein
MVWATWVTCLSHGAPPPAQGAPLRPLPGGPLPPPTLAGPHLEVEEGALAAVLPLPPGAT